MDPIIKDNYTAEERAVIAGYLIKKRAGLLNALAAVGSPQFGSTEGWAEGTYKYWKDCERYSRFLLHYAGYEVPKNKNYGQE